jgi:hypothetical protein
MASFDGFYRWRFDSGGAFSGLKLDLKGTFRTSTRVNAVFEECMVVVELCTRLSKFVRATLHAGVVKG